MIQPTRLLIDLAQNSNPSSAAPENSSSAAHQVQSKRSASLPVAQQLALAQCVSDKSLRWQDSQKLRVLICSITDVLSKAVVPVGRRGGAHEVLCAVIQ